MMKSRLILHFFLLVLAVTFVSCKTSQSRTSYETSGSDTILIACENPKQAFQINVIKGASFNHPTLVFWIEDLEGNLIKTFYLTKSYAMGEFGHAQLSDSTWADKPGKSFQPAAIPYWNHKKGYTDGATLVPTPEHPYTDATSSATPINNFVLKGRLPVIEGPFRLLLEVNQTWDWNRYWTNGKYPENTYYKNSAQPSLIYSVLISKVQTGKTYHLNPMGHGHPAGRSGELFTDISTLTTARHIFNSVTIKF